MANQSPAVGVKERLLAAPAIGLNGGLTAWGIFIGTMPPKPDACIAIFDTPGANSSPKWLLDFPQVQILVRGNENGYPQAYQKLIDCRDRILGMDPMVIAGDRWDGVTQVGSAAFLQYDENNRPIFTSNYRIILEPAASASSHREPL